MRPPARTLSLDPDIAGSRCFSASPASGSRRAWNSGDATTRRASARSRVIIANAPVKLLDGLHRHIDELKAEPLTGGLDRLHGRRMRWRRGIPENRDALRVRNDLRQYLQLLGDEIGEQHRQAGDVEPRPGQTLH